MICLPEPPHFARARCRLRRAGAASDVVRVAVQRLAPGHASCTRCRGFAGEGPPLAPETMSYQFPADVAYLPRTKLAYVNLPGILTDGKRDRAGRVSGYVSIQLGERCYLVFLRGGEAFNAARIQPDGRGPVALSEVVRLVATESERGEAGQIGYFGASEAQLQAMLATLVHAPVAFDQPIDTARPDQLFPHLRDRRFTGVLELSDGRRFHYVVLEEGQYRSGWFTGRDPAVPAGDFLRAFFASAGGGLRGPPDPGPPRLPGPAGAGGGGPLPPPRGGGGRGAPAVPGLARAPGAGGAGVRGPLPPHRGRGDARPVAGGGARDGHGDGAPRAGRGGAGAPLRGRLPRHRRGAHLRRPGRLAGRAHRGRGRLGHRSADHRVGRPRRRPRGHHRAHRPREPLRARRARLLHPPPLGRGAVARAGGVRPASPPAMPIRRRPGSPPSE